MTATSSSTSPAVAPRSVRAAVAPFRALVGLTVGANAIVAAVLLLGSPSWSSALTSTLTAATVNIGITALIRQQYVVNLLFRIATSAPLSWPLRVRRALAEIYHLGGIHVGCATAAVTWFLGFAVIAVTHPPAGPDPRVVPALQATTVLIAAALIAILATAAPSMRERHHPVFEAVHRYGGWLVVILFVALTVLLALDSSGSMLADVVGSPDSWILVAVAASIAVPWLQLRRVPVNNMAPSDHVLLSRFDYGVHPAPGTFSRISRSPLGESHAFADIPAPGADGFRLAISRAGGWTGGLIDNPPSTLWVRGTPTSGVATVARLFTRVVWVATGSGIAPCLPHLLTGDTPSQLVWVTRNPARTYGDALLAEITTAQPNAVIWDTDALGKPDLADLAEGACRDSGAEAVICISNKKTTLTLVTTLRERGVAAYGPIWDS